MIRRLTGQVAFIFSEGLPEINLLLAAISNVLQMNPSMFIDGNWNQSFFEKSIRPNFS